MNDSKNYLKHSLIIIIVCFFAFFANNSFLPADLMESRNLATAQEMVTQGNYLTPTMNGELRLEKPPLPTWISACIDIVAPDSISAQRCAAGIAATLLVFFLYLLVIELTGNKLFGLISALVLASSYNVIMMGRTATWDIYCHSFMLGALYFLLKALNKEGAQWTRLIVSGLLMGLSFLSKGPVSFYAMMLPFLISYFIIFRPSLKGKAFSITTMIIVCLIVSLWWPVYIYFFHRDWGIHVVNKESTSWLNHNVRPWYYYWNFPTEAGIWTLFWIASLVWPYWRNRFRIIQIKKAYLFSILWTFSALILLSLMPEKKMRYLLPLLIPGALNIAFYIFYCITNRISHREKVIFRINVSVILVILVALPVALYLLFVQKGYLSIGLFIVTSVLSLTLAGMLFHYTFKSENKLMHSFFGIVSVMILVEVLCFIPASKLFINDNRHSIKEVRKISRDQKLPFYYIKGDEIHIELIYESNKIIRPLDIKNDSLVLAKLPFVILSRSAPDSLFQHLNVNVEHIDVYDNNWKKRDKKNYNKDLVRYVSIIKAK